MSMYSGLTSSAVSRLMLTGSSAIPHLGHEPGSDLPHLGMHRAGVFGMARGGGFRVGLHRLDAALRDADIAPDSPRNFATQPFEQK